MRLRLLRWCWWSGSNRSFRLSELQLGRRMKLGSKNNRVLPYEKLASPCENDHACNFSHGLNQANS